MTAGIEDYRLIKRQMQTLYKEHGVVRALLNHDSLTDEEKNLLLNVYFRLAGISPSSSEFTIADLSARLVTENNSEQSNE